MQSWLDTVQVLRKPFRSRLALLSPPSSLGFMEIIGLEDWWMKTTVSTQKGRWQEHQWIIVKQQLNKYPMQA